MKKSTEIKAELESLKAEVEAIVKVAEDEKRELASDEQQRVDAILNEGGLRDQLDSQLERAMKIEAVQKERIRAVLGDQLNQQLIDVGIKKPEAKVPATAKKHSPLKCFKNEQDAYASGQFVLATIYGNSASRKWCDDHGYNIRNSMVTTDNAKGGYLVPEPLENTIIELREQYGVFRRNAFLWPMSDGVALVPKLAGEVDAFYVGEMGTIPTSSMNLAQIKLEARKLATLIPVSSELGEDAVIAVAEMIARSIAQKFSIAEDDAGFNGNGTSTYGGIFGLANALAAGCKENSATTFGGITLAHFQKLRAKLRYYSGISPKWYISKEGYHDSMERLMNAVGGNTNITIANGAPVRFMGDEVEFVQVMERDLAAVGAGKVFAYYGDLRMTAYMGSRRGLNIVADESFYFNQDAVAIRATQRFDINVHERGTATTSGSMVALIST